MFRQRLKEFRQSWRLWLTVGIGVKRWLLLLCLGAWLVGIGVLSALAWVHLAGWLPTAFYELFALHFLPIGWRAALTLLLGVALTLLAVERLGSRLVAPFRRPDEGVAESLYRYSKGRRGPRVVAIGGGTGMPGLLRGLKEHTSNITAIVTVADDGGSSGRLRRELGLLPPGDFRNNIAALARDEALMTQLMQYRFGASLPAEEPGPLRGHAFGNLLLAALTGITGSFDQALLAMERVLAMQGRVMPSTLTPVTLIADVQTPAGLQRVAGESRIPEAGGRIQRVYLEPTPKAYPPALQAILQADLVVMGPGSLYTSVLPNLLVPDLAEALRHTRAPKVYVCNLATQPGETDGFSVADHVAALVGHVSADILDLVLANNNLSVPPDTGGGHTLYVQPIPPSQVPMLTADLVDRQRPWRHDSAKVAQVVINLLAANEPGAGGRNSATL